MTIKYSSAIYAQSIAEGIINSDPPLTFNKETKQVENIAPALLDWFYKTAASCPSGRTPRPTTSGSAK